MDSTLATEGICKRGNIGSYNCNAGNGLLI